MQTVCKQCIFAQVEDMSQVGCSFDGRLEKYINKGMASKNDNWYFTIDTKCEACTTVSVGQLVPDDIQEIIRNNISPTVDAVVYGDDDTIVEILEAIKNDGYKNIIACQPNMIGIRSYSKFSEVFPRIITSSQIDNRYEFEYLDNGCYKSKANYLAIINSPVVPKIPEVVVDHTMNQLTDFIGIISDDINGLVIKPKIYKFLYGNCNEPIIDKIKAIPNYESMTLKWNNQK